MSNQKWVDLAASACDHAGVEHETIDIITTWEQTFTHNENLFRNNAVMRLDGERILKLFGAHSKRSYHVERACLHTFATYKTVLAPQLIAHGELANGQLYLIMTAIEGEPLQEFREIRDELSKAEFSIIAREIAHITTALHHLPTDILAAAEKQAGGRQALIKEEKAKRLSEIDAMDKLSEKHKAELRRFTEGEGLTFLDVPPVLTHSDFSWAHVFMKRHDNTVKVTGFIDWGEAMLGPPEWDVAFHWLWTFSQDKDSMREFLTAYYADTLPERLARRLFAAHYYTFSMEESWDYIDFDIDDDADIVRDIIRQLFPPDVFGSPE